MQSSDLLLCRVLLRCLALGGAASTHLTTLDRVQVRTETLIWNEAMSSSLQYSQDVACLTTLYKVQKERAAHALTAAVAASPPNRCEHRAGYFSTACLGHAAFTHDYLINSDNLRKST